MKNALTLTEKETFFLKENRQDPVTGDEFSVGDEIVFCASCKSAFLKESWEYMNSKHCGQTFTLKKFPVQSKLKLSKPIVYDFRKADTNNRIFAYLIDNLVAIVLATISFFAFMGFNNNFFDVLPFLIGIAYMLFRDIIGIKSSIGKRIMGLYFIHTQTQKKASPFVLLFRNVFYWICLFAAISLVVFLEAVTGASGVIGSLLGFGLLIANIVHVIIVLANQTHIFDRILRIELVEKRK
ncbi:RDD family protein [Bernardetia sp. Wsw4-3y2]|uniref:RDD family protein n=1 Tax=Bernardetia sp. Wsw4-3y2 TaxID=3127471 RepID=UPI0030D1790D